MANLDYLSILSVAVPVYLTMGAGALARKTGLLKAEADVSLMKLSVMMLTPALIIERVVGNPAVMSLPPVLVAAGLGYGLVALGIALTYLVAPLVGLKRGEGRRTFSVACGLQNYGFVAIPIVTALFPDQGTLGVLFTFTLGVELACWTVGVGLLTGLDKAPWRLALNAPVITILISLLLNFTGLHAHVPLLAHNTFAMLGACAVPLAVLLIGASIADLWGQGAMQWKVAIVSPILRLGIIPIAFLLVAYHLPISLELKRVIVVQAAMPSAVFNIMIARLYGGHATTAVQVVIATTVVSCITTPLVIAWGLKLVGV
ncbi:AEC family transporter [Prosthecobacter sp.]|uniref:AEC family transporter n=1 Tax=Prosthecobacter sp. TaxID=1965333 RepID=UPI002488BA45|nr:AEC family transporter [Prosthecobacter sp.]MDI1311327.1 AEC family transporter [Prosthecobacter sp.]